MGGYTDLTLFSVWWWTLISTTTSPNSNILSSLADLDFHRIRADHLHSSAAAATDSPVVSIRRGLIGGGYHRELLTNIKMEEVAEVEGFRDRRNRRILVLENITRDMYMDLDQVRLYCPTKELIVSYMRHFSFFPLR